MRWLLWLVLAFAIACSRGGSTAVFSGGRGPGEPVYTPGVSTLLWQDNMDAYVSGLAMYDNSKSSSYAGFADVAWVYYNAPHDPGARTTREDGATDHTTGTTAGNALRLVYGGAYQESHNIFLAKNGTFGQYPTDYTKPAYITYWFRLQGAIPNVKWIEWWHPGSNLRLQFNTFWDRQHTLRNPAAYGFPAGWGEVWTVMDGNTFTTANGQQPYPPTADQSLGPAGHRVTYAYKPNNF